MKNSNEKVIDGSIEDTFDETESELYEQDDLYTDALTIESSDNFSIPPQVPYDEAIHKVALEEHYSKTKPLGEVFEVSAHLLKASISPMLSQLMKQLSIVIAAKALDSGKLKEFTGKVDVDAKQLPKVEEVDLFAALLGCPDLIKNISVAIQIPTANIGFPHEVFEARESIGGTLIPNLYAVDKDSPNNNWFFYAARYVPFLDFSPETLELLQKVLNFADGEYELCIIKIAQFFEDSSSKNNSAFVRSLRQINKGKSCPREKLKNTARLTKSLTKKIKGQDEATKSLVKSYSAFAQCGNDNVSMHTMIGASGTGKTFSAETLSESVSSIYNNGYKTLVINMENYAEEKDSMKLFGVGFFYTEAALGHLTSKIAAYPRYIVVFDELEKAHPKVQQSLLTVLSKGKAKDESTNQYVDFSQCIFISTSNLGQEELSKHGNTLSNINLNACLRGKDGKGFSPELINRIASGNVAIFKPLETQDLLALAEDCIQQHSENDTSITWPINAPELMLKTLAGNATARAIKKQMSHLKSDIETKLVEEIDFDEDNVSANVVVSPVLPVSGIKASIVWFGPKSSKNIDHTSNVHQQCFESVALFKENESINSTDAIIAVEHMLEDEDIFAAEKLARQHNVRFYLTTTNGSAKHPLNYEYIFTNTNGFKKSILSKVVARNEIYKELQTQIRRKIYVDYQIIVDKKQADIVVSINKLSHQISQDSNDFDLPFLNLEVKPKETFSDVIGNDEAKNELKRFVKAFQSNSPIKKMLPKGLILTGAPGTGKTLLARAFANEIDMPMLNVNAADLLSGNAIANIKALTELAHKIAPCTLFLDEVEVIAGKREKNTLTALATNTLLTAMDGFNKPDEPIFFLGATNHAEWLSSAATRAGRFEKSITCHLPNEEERMAALQALLLKYDIAMSKQQSEKIASLTENRTVAFLEQLVKEAAIQLHSQDSQLSDSDIWDLYLSLTMGKQKTAPIDSQKTQNIVAFHEAGHVLASYLLRPETTIELVTLESRGNAPGFTLFNQQNNSLGLNKKDLSIRLQVFMAGRAAEKLYLVDEDLITSGCSADLAMATDIAKKATEKLGIGNDSLIDHTQFQHSDTYLKQDVEAQISKAYTSVAELLEQHYYVLIAIAEALVSKKTLYTEDIASIIKRTTPHEFGMVS